MQFRLHHTTVQQFQTELRKLRVIHISLLHTEL